MTLSRSEGAHLSVRKANHSMSSLSRVKLSETVVPSSEQVLLDQFRTLLEELFQHDSANAHATLEQLMLHHAWDLVDGAGLLADTDFGAERAGYMCRRACDLRRLAVEFTQFLDAAGPAERAELPTIRGERYQRELQEQHPELIRKLQARSGEVAK